MQLLWIIVASNMLVAAGFGMMAYPWWHFLRFQRPSLLVLLSPTGILVLALIMDLITKETLKNGVEGNYWPNSLLNGSRKLVDQPVFSILFGILFGASVLSIVYFFSSHTRTSGAAWVFLYPSMSLTHIRIALRPKPPSSSDFLLRLSEPSEPIRSEHWKTPPSSFIS